MTKLLEPAARQATLPQSCLRPLLLVLRSEEGLGRTRNSPRGCRGAGWEPQLPCGHWEAGASTRQALQQLGWWRAQAPGPRRGPRSQQRRGGAGPARRAAVSSGHWCQRQADAGTAGAPRPSPHGSTLSMADGRCTALTCPALSPSAFCPYRYQLKSGETSRDFRLMRQWGFGMEPGSSRAGPRGHGPHQSPPFPGPFHG